MPRDGPLAERQPEQPLADQRPDLVLDQLLAKRRESGDPASAQRLLDPAPALAKAGVRG